MTATSSQYIFHIQKSEKLRRHCRIVSKTRQMQIKTLWQKAFEAAQHWYAISSILIVDKKILFILMRSSVNKKPYRWVTAKKIGELRSGKNREFHCVNMRKPR